MPKENHSQWMREKITGFWLARAIHIAAGLKVADHLAHGPRSVLALSKLTGSDKISLGRLLRALASEGIFRERNDSKFELTPKADLLRSRHPDSLRAYAEWYGSEPWEVFGKFNFSIKSGKSVFRELEGTDYFSFLKKNKAAAARFDAAMSSVSFRQAKAISSAYDFSRYKTIADIAGGEGLLLSNILKKARRSQGVLVDLPKVIHRAKQAPWWKRQARCRFIAADFLKKLTVTADLYLLKYILHDWNDEDCLSILRNIKNTMPSNSRLLIIEQLIETGNKPQFAKLADLHMLALLGGRERSLREYSELLDAAGLKLQKVHPTNYLLHILETTPK